MSTGLYNIDVASAPCEIDKKSTYVDPETCMSDGEIHKIVLSKNQEATLVFEGLLAGEKYKVRDVISDRCGKITAVASTATNECCPEAGCVDIEVCGPGVRRVCLYGPQTYMVRHCGGEMGDGPISYQIC